jgi:hypothetical protein
MRSFLVACIISLSVALLGFVGCGDSENKAATAGTVKGGYTDADSDTDSDADIDTDTEESEESDVETTDTESDTGEEVDTDEDVINMWSCLICDGYRYEE